jgi:hypothetical protein
MIRSFLSNRRGSVALLTGVSITMVIALAAISVDVGFAYTSWNKLNASAQAAAIAGARDIGVGGTPISTATAYGSLIGGKNVISGLTNVAMAAGYPALACYSGAVTRGLACSTNQTPATAANGIQVKETASVPLFFGRMFGVPSISISASAAALAAGQAPPPLNVMFIVDATASMGSNDPVCGLTRLGCAISGFKTLLGELWPCAYGLSSCGTATPVDEAALLQFPGVQTLPVNGACGALATVPYAGVKGTTSAATAATSAVMTFTAAPQFGFGPNALITDQTNPSIIPAGDYVKSITGVSATMNVKPTAQINKGDAIAVWPPNYQLIGLSNDYRTSDTATLLNSNSNLIKCLNTLTPPGGYGTFYADAIQIAQANLLANTRTGARNVIILLSDGEANATAASGKVNMVAQGPNWQTTTAKNECKNAVLAAQAAASAGTWVYAVSYGSSTGGCSTDTGVYANACYVMSQIANIPGAVAGTFVNDPTKFYADNANGCASASHPSITAIKSIFQNIQYSLTTPRLLPAACLALSRPTWC